MTYVFEGLDPAPYATLADAGEAELRARGVVAMTVDKFPGSPCRVTLDDAPRGARVFLLNHVSRAKGSPYHAAHAIFVTDGAGKAARYVDMIPPALERRVLSLRAFDCEGMMVEAALVQPGQADGGLRRLFDNPNVIEVDAHNAVRGCFAARARRA